MPALNRIVLLEHVRMEVQGSTKTVYLTKDDYYINLEGTGSGTMNYTVEEIANDETKRTVQFLQIMVYTPSAKEPFSAPIMPMTVWSIRMPAVSSLVSDCHW